MKRFLLVLALVVGAGVPIGIATASTKVPTRDLKANGGTVKFSATVKNAKACTWSSSPKVAGFDATAECKTGKVERSARFKANRSTKAKHFGLTLTARGDATTVWRLRVVEKGRATITGTSPTTTAPPSSDSNTTAPPSSGSSTTVPSSSSTTTTPGTMTFSPNVSGSGSETDIPCSQYYCWDFSATLTDFGSYEPPRSGNDLPGTVTVTYHFNSETGTVGSGTFTWEPVSSTVGISGGAPTGTTQATVSYSGGSYVDTSGRTIILNPASETFAVSGL